jgi:hypothetical protein
MWRFCEEFSANWNGTPPRVVLKNLEKIFTTENTEVTEKNLNEDLKKKNP